LGASVAFYSLLSFAPLLVLITAVIAIVFGQQSAQHELVHVARQWMGEKGAETVDSLLKNAQKPSSGIFATIVAFTTLLFGASGVFGELHDALNIIWEVPPKTDAGVFALIKEKLFSFGMVLSVGFLLLISLVLSAALAFMGRYFGYLVPLPAPVLEAINFLVSIAVIAALFALMFKYVPNAEVSWRDVTVGALGTAILFTIGKFLLGLYLGKASVGSPYGAAGSLVAVIVWIYYSAQIFFFGAEFTHVYARAHAPGVKDVPEHAETTSTAPVQAKVGKVPAAAAGPPAPIPVTTAFENVNRTPQVAASKPSGPVNVISQEVIRQTQAALLPISAKRAPFQSKPKPQLLMAVGLGFVLGRAFDFVNGRAHGESGTGSSKAPRLFQ